MKTRGKFRCTSVKSYGPQYSAQEYSFTAVCNDVTPTSIAIEALKS